MNEGHIMNASSLRRLLSGSYIPFGSQYYRAPSPDRSQWETDLTSMADLGFNTVKFWVQWRWNHPAENEFSFSDIDELMEIAGRVQLRVMLNTIVDVAPAWVYRKWPDAAMITLDGRAAGPQTQPHRQIGGLGLCFNHREAMEQLYRFIRATVERYAKHPALEMWNVGSEPELTSSMSEMRLYADDAASMGDMLCYCPRCLRAFREWIKAKYGSLDALNTSWNRNYRSFDELEVPRTRNTFNDMVDWRMFFVDVLGKNVQRRFEVARDADQGKHPLLCHHVFIQGFPVTSTANDPWNVGQYGDLHGFTQMDDPMMADVLRSAAKGKPVISAEMLMLYGYTLELPRPITHDDINRFIFTGIAANLKGFIFWQYRPELLGREAPAWGLTTLDGKPTRRLELFAETNQVLQKNVDLLLDGTPPEADVAILYDPENQIFAWASTGSEKNATNSLLGVHRALYESNFRVDFIHPREIEQGILEHYRVVFLPFPYFMRRSIAEKLQAWVAKGGTLIGESYIAGWNPEGATHQSIVPGHGLSSVFQVRQGEVEPAPEGVVMTLAMPFGSLPKGARIEGSLVKECLVPEGASVIARFAGGAPAVTKAHYGKGTAIAIGSYVARRYAKDGNEQTRKFFASMASLGSAVARPTASGAGRIRVDIVTAEGKKSLLVVRNLTSRSWKGTITIPQKLAGALQDQFTSRTVRTRRTSRGSSFSLVLGPGAVKVYRA
jgi:beta-galactosidase